MNDNENHRNERADKRRDGSDFSVAMSRLEKAVQELVSATTGEITDRASSLLDETSKRIESEVRLKRVEEAHPEERPAHERRRRRHRHRHTFSDMRRASDLYIDPSEEKVAGVCAGFARYFGVETWIVRMGALTGLIFMPGVVFPAYWIAYFVMEKRTDGKKSTRRRRRPRNRDRRDEQSAAMLHDEFEAELAAGEAEVDNKRTRSDGPDPEFNATRNLRHITTDMTQAELRLRRMESFVTSDRYELHKELAKIERDGATT